MDIFIVDTTNGTKTTLPMLPEEISVKAAANFLDFSILDIGEIKIPKGADLTTFSWDGKFPGKTIKDSPYVRGTWQQPDAYVSLFDRYKYQGIPLQLIATDSPINVPVYVSEFDVTFKGSNGWDYSIDLVQRKIIQVAAVPGNTKAAPSKSKAKAPARTAAQVKTYTVKKGDTLWKISERFLGKGSRYMEIFNANKTKIKNPNLIYAGQVLNIP